MPNEDRKQSAKGEVAENVDKGAPVEGISGFGIQGDIQDVSGICGSFGATQLWHYLAKNRHVR